MKNATIQIGNTINIEDSKSLFNGKTGIITGFLGRNVEVAILLNGETRTIVVGQHKYSIIN